MYNGDYLSLQIINFQIIYNLFFHSCTKSEELCPSLWQREVQSFPPYPKDKINVTLQQLLQGSITTSFFTVKPSIKYQNKGH